MQNQNIQIIQNMFLEFAEKMNIQIFDDFHTKDFILECNGKTYSYEEYKNIQAQSYEELQSLKVISEDIFAVDDKVAARIRMHLIYKDQEEKIFQVYLIAKMKDGKIQQLWELTYPG